MPRQSQSTRSSRAQSRHQGSASVFTCPDCQGTLFFVENNGLKRFRCRTGHAYSPESMLEAQDDNVERLMWSAVRALDEQAEYINELARELMHADHKLAQTFAAKARAAQHSAQIIRNLITHGTEDRQARLLNAK